MSIEDHKKHIEKVIRKTFETVKKVYENQQELNGLKDKNSGSRIIFPMKSVKEDGQKEPETRLSEQELRFVFVEQLINYRQTDEGKNWDVYYSIETPSKDKYVFKNNPPRLDNYGQSARFDLVIHDADFRRIALIEFKANNPDIHDYQKDFVKLTNEKEEGELRYFIQLLASTRSDTESSVRSKIKPKEDNSKINWMAEWGNKAVVVICESLEKSKKDKKEVINFEPFSKE